MSTPAITPTPPHAPTAQSALGQVRSFAALMTGVPADRTTVTNYYEQSVYDPSDKKASDLVCFSGWP
jgi:hypothetical protein